MDTQKINESRGFEVIGTHPTENSLEDQLNNKEYIGYFLSSDPDERDYFMKCPFCRGLIPDTGLCETVECDTCKKIIRIPENNFQEVKQASLYDEPLRHKKKHCKNIQNFCKKISYFLPFIKNPPIYQLPSFRHITLYINKEKLDNSSYHGKNFTEIMNNIIIPFFQYKSRIVNKDKIFEIDGVEFKVISVNPHYLSGKVSSGTSIVCNDYYSFTTPILNATFLTIKKRELETSDYIANKIINTPFPTQKSIIEGLNCRINTYDLVVRNCSPKYGIITNDTNIRVIHRNIETIKSITIAILFNEENTELNNKKNNKTIYNNFIIPYFFNGNKKYIERGDTLQIGKLEIFILKAKPSTGFVVEDITKISMKYNYNLEQCQDELNEQIEKESLRNRHHSNVNNNINITNDGIINTSTNSENNFVVFNQFQERMRVLNDLLAHRRRLIRLHSHLNNIYYRDDDNYVNINFNFFNRENEGNNINNDRVLRSLPVFKIDEKFMEVSQKEENKNEQFQKCVICMEKYMINDEVKTLPCFHLFHKECIDHWLKSGKDTCPICKNKINNNNLEEDFIDN